MRTVRVLYVKAKTFRGGMLRARACWGNGRSGLSLPTGGSFLV